LQVVQAEHFDFELNIWAAENGYWAEVMDSPAGRSARVSLATLALIENRQAADNLRLRLENAILRSASAIRGRLSIEETTFREFGQAVFDNVFRNAGPIAEKYKESLKKINAGGGDRRRLRIKLRIEAPELAQLPWEYLYNSGDSEWVGLQFKTPIIRSLGLERETGDSTVDGPLNVLGMIANPAGYVTGGLANPLDTAKERALIESALKPLQVKGKVNLRWVPGETVEELIKTMSLCHWHVFHFIGHGGSGGATDEEGSASEGFIVLADETGGPKEVPASELKDYLQGPYGRPRLVVLNCCDGAREGRRSFTSPAATLVRSGVSSVVAMQFPISEPAASRFAASFYEQIADNAPIEDAVTRTRLMIKDKSIEWGSPVLYTRARGGRLFAGITGRDSASATLSGSAVRAGDETRARRRLQELFAA
jgi:hypothetical protein